MTHLVFAEYSMVNPMTEHLEKKTTFYNLLTTCSAASARTIQASFPRLRSLVASRCGGRR